jgi:hypothetical protein
MAPITTRKSARKEMPEDIARLKQRLEGSHRADAAA